MIKNLIPSNTRVELRFLQQKIKGFINGQHIRLVKKSDKKVELPIQISLSQIIKSNSYSGNKLDNLKLASSFINHKLISPDKVFSFWNLIPRPTHKRGFKKGRNLIGSELSLDYGGGLCQLSGVLYHLSLIAGMEIIERHPHSKDIYTEQSRYTPLGSDATVVYGYKDLKLKNSLKQDICFNIELESEKITAHLCALKPIQKREIVFKSIDEGAFHKSMVYLLEGDVQQLISINSYEKLYPE